MIDLIHLCYLLFFKEATSFSRSPVKAEPTGEPAGLGLYWAKGKRYNGKNEESKDEEDRRNSNRR
jgi:hypothetical protein